VLLDAPCSATGTIRRHPDVPWQKRPADIATLAALQTRLLDRAAALTRKGGVLAYAVCSLEPEEGERQVEAFLARRRDFARVPVAPAEVGGVGSFVSVAGDLRTLPCHLPAAEPRLSGCDGFYAARLRRLS
jgi:16S rRNA (cytosine967-C5)-methyltransferase